MAGELPGDVELRAFAASVLGDLGQQLGEEAIRDTVEQYRDTWHLLYEVHHGRELAEPPKL